MKWFALGLLAILGSVEAIHLQKNHKELDEAKVRVYFYLEKRF
jgi:hypothetical protein